MDSMKNWYRSRSMSFGSAHRPTDFGNNASDFKTQSYGPTDRAMKSAQEVCKKLTPSVETKTAMLNTVKDVKGYSRKFIPNEQTKQKVSRFYESQVAKLKYSQLKDGFHPGSRSDDTERFCDDDSYYGGASESPRTPNYRDQEVPSFESLSAAPMRGRAASCGANTGPAKPWNGSFMQEPARRQF